LNQTQLVEVWTLNAGDPGSSPTDTEKGHWWHHKGHLTRIAPMRQKSPPD